ncbi:MAG: hypothetical protein ABI193_07205, partial [Minicystis sp.]
LLACAPMAIVVHYIEVPVLHTVGTPVAQLFQRIPALSTIASTKVLAGTTMIVEVIVGALVFVISALLIAPGASRDLIRLVRDARQRRIVKEAG